MKQRFTQDELYCLRNLIPIDWFIQKVLKLTVSLSGDVFRFQCPDCQQFDTAINPNTNLARCFVCKKNFNTIDLIIQIKKLSFVEAVTALQQCYARIPQRQINSSNITTRSKQSYLPKPSTSQSELTALSKILADYNINKS